MRVGGVYDCELGQQVSFSQIVCAVAGDISGLAVTAEIEIISAGRVHVKDYMPTQSLYDLTNSTSLILNDVYPKVSARSGGS